MTYISPFSDIFLKFVFLNWTIGVIQTLMNYYSDIYSVYKNKIMIPAIMGTLIVLKSFLWATFYTLAQFKWFRWSNITCFLSLSINVYLKPLVLKFI